MRKYLEKSKNGVYYIAEGYNEQQMVVAGFSNVTEGISAGRKMIRAMGNSLSESIYAIKWEDGYAVYAVCAKEDIERLEGYIIVNTVGELIGKGGAFWSKHTSARIRNLIGEEVI